jgi:hypothetical protein|nr:MAG TPA: hypothetical protein [Caudoviricetes sp.]
MSRITELEKQITELDERKVELQKELELEKQKNGIEYPPLNLREEYWIINDRGEIRCSWWYNDSIDKTRCKIGNIFLTEEKAEKEFKKLSLLTRFRQFRDKSNGDWKPEWLNKQERKYFMGYLAESKSYEATSCSKGDLFILFGYFKNQNDCKRAIELFGDEIKRLFVEE